MFIALVFIACQYIRFSLLKLCVNYQGPVCVSVSVRVCVCVCVSVSVKLLTVIS